MSTIATTARFAYDAIKSCQLKEGEIIEIGPAYQIAAGIWFDDYEIVKQLLEKGYAVRGTVRSTGSTPKIEHLTNLGSALPGKLTLHEADLLSDGSFDDVVKGADFVVHAASPFIRDFTDPQKELVEPAVHGTKNVLSAVAKHKDTVKTTVVTSSFASVVKPKKGPFKEVFDEEDWNDESTLEDGPYRLSKVTAEKAAWALSKEHGFKLVVINPTFVLGPVVGSRADATSIKSVKNMLEKQSGGFIPWVCDVRDVAAAHVKALELPSAQGRYIVSQPNTFSPKFFTDALNAAFPGLNLEDGKDEPTTNVLSSDKVQRELGLQLTDPALSIVDMARTLIATGIARPKM